jgi:hypothetical protein
MEDQMENKGMIKRIIMGFLCLAAIVLIGLSIFQQIRLNKAAETNANTAVTKSDVPAISPQPSKKNLSKTAANGDKGKEANKNDVALLKDQLDSTEQELDTANNKLSAEMSRKSELKKKEAELQQQYLKDPSLKKYLRSSLDMNYSDIFKELNLSPEKLEKLKDILVDKTFAKVQLSPEIQNASTKEQKDDLLKRYNAIREESETKTRELLGNADYEKFEAYNDRGNTRYFVNGYKDTLSANDQLTKDQENALVELMFKEEKRVYAEIGYDPNKMIEFPSDIKEGKVAGVLKNTEKIHLASIESAKGTLTASQLGQFKSYLNNYREMVAMSYKLSNQ